MNGAEDWNRTSTRNPPQEPESCASTNSATSACGLYIIINPSMQAKIDKNTLIVLTMGAFTQYIMYWFKFIRILMQLLDAANKIMVKMRYIQGAA